MADNTASLVVALSAQLTKFERDMKQAGVMADNAVNDIEQKFSRMNPQINASFLGNLFSTFVTKGFDAALKALTDFKDRFLELQKVAEVTGESMAKVWGFTEAAAKFGATTESAAKGFYELARLLNEMQRGEQNALSRLYDYNPKALQGLKRDSLTVEQNWQNVANMVRDANTEFDAIDIAKHAGFSADMVKALRQGGPAMAAIAAEAERAAPNLQMMADNAKAFHDASKSAVTWAKSSVADTFYAGIRDTCAKSLDCSRCCRKAGCLPAERWKISARIC